MNKIIGKMKAYPEKSVSQIALSLGVSTVEVAKAQGAYLRQFMPCNSPLWGKPGESVSAFRYDANNN
jgi:hypothetical protein